MSKKPSLQLFLNGAEIKMHNKRIVFFEREDRSGVIVQFFTTRPKEDVDKKTTFETTHKQIVHETQINISTESMGYIAFAYNLFKEQQMKDDAAKKSNLTQA